MQSKILTQFYKSWEWFWNSRQTHICWLSFHKTQVDISNLKAIKTELVLF